MPASSGTIRWVINTWMSITTDFVTEIINSNIGNFNFDNNNTSNKMTLTIIIIMLFHAVVEWLHWICIMKRAKILKQENYRFSSALCIVIYLHPVPMKHSKETIDLLNCLLV